MTVWLKQGVIGDLHPKAQKAFGIIERLYKDRGLDFYVTAIRDGNHMAGSFHYIGLAFDFRKAPGISRKMIQGNIGVDYDVIEHATHIHVEYDPK